MATTTTEQIIREAPDIEAYKLGLLSSAKALTDTPLNLPAYQVAGLNADQTASFDLARQGIGAYKPYVEQASRSLTQGTGMVGEGADVLRGADTRNQFGGAQQAMNLAGAAAGQMTGAANQMGQVAGNINPAYQYIQQGLGATQQGIGQLMGATGQYDPRAAAAYMNPYQQQVIDAAVSEMNRQRDIQAQNIKSEASRAGAYGGSREAIMQSELNRNNAQLQNQAIANLMAQGYTQAQANSMTGYEQAQQRALAAGQALGNIGATQGSLGGQLGNVASQQANIYGNQAGVYGQQSGLYSNIGQGIGNLAAQQFGIGRDMASGLGALGTQMGNLGVQQGALGQSVQQMGQSDVNMLYNVGKTQQDQEQAKLDAARNTALQNEMAPYQQLGFLSDIYKGAPSSQSSITASSAPTPSALSQAAGLGIAGLAAGAGAKKAGLF